MGDNPYPTLATVTLDYRELGARKRRERLNGMYVMSLGRKKRPTGCLLGLLADRNRQTDRQFEPDPPRLPPRPRILGRSDGHAPHTHVGLTARHTPGSLIGRNSSARRSAPAEEDLCCLSAPGCPHARLARVMLASCGPRMHHHMQMVARHPSADGIKRALGAINRRRRRGRKSPHKSVVAARARCPLRGSL